MAQMAIVATLLGEHALSTYVDIFEEKGYDDLAKLLWHAEKDIEQVYVGVGMTKHGHQARLRNALNKARSRM